MCQSCLSASSLNTNRFEPPTQSKPEAANFPSHTYTFSNNNTLFKAPQAYPEPPQDMWYKVPQTKPKPAEAPKPIFPWEREPDRPRATRIFAEDAPPEPTPIVSTPTHAFSTVHYDDGNRSMPGEANRGPTPESVSSPKSADEQWQVFQQGNGNAWDSVPGIETYVRAMVDSQGKRGKPQSLQQSTGTEDISSPILQRRNRRESLILTDFPSAIERPSLPVTPAPLRRPSFWGEERSEAGELPSATGVPEQQEWVCPQCGFSSVNASVFQHRRESFTSTTTAVVTPPSSVVPAVLPKVRHVNADVSNALKIAEPKGSSTTLSNLSLESVEKRLPGSLVRSVPSSLEARAGLSPNGVPLASLTSPEILASRGGYLGPNTPLAATSDLQRTLNTPGSTQLLVR